MVPDLPFSWPVKTSADQLQYHARRGYLKLAAASFARASSDVHLATQEPDSSAILRTGKVGRITIRNAFRGARICAIRFLSSGAAALHDATPHENMTSARNISCCELPECSSRECVTKVTQERGLQTGTMGAICTPILAFVSIFASIKASLGRIRTSNSATSLNYRS